jgi:hypothetical protein
MPLGDALNVELEIVGAVRIDDRAGLGWLFGHVETLLAFRR